VGVPGSDFHIGFGLMISEQTVSINHEHEGKGHMRMNHPDRPYAVKRCFCMLIDTRACL
jgi:hypothetical protein